MTLLDSLVLNFCFLAAKDSEYTNKDLEEIQVLVRSAARDCVPQERNSIVGFQASTGVEVNLARETLKGLLAHWLAKRKQRFGSQPSANGDLLSGKDISHRSITHSRIEVDSNAENDSMVYPPFEFSSVYPPSIITEGSHVQRLTFKEFFDHKFLKEPRPMVEVELSVVLPTMKIKTILKQRKDCVNTSITKSGFTPNIASDRLRKSVDGDAFFASMESIEKDYVIINAYFASMDAFSFYLETSVQDKSTTRVSICPSGKSDKDIAVEIQTMELADSSVGAAQSHGSDLLVTSSASSIIREVQGLTILHPLTTLHLLYQYVQALAELSQEKYNAGLLLESFSVELVVLAIWKKALQICSSWLASAAEGELPENCDSTKEWVTGFGIASISSLALSGFNDGIGMDVEMTAALAPAPSAVSSGMCVSNVFWAPLSSCSAITILLSPATSSQTGISELEDSLTRCSSNDHPIQHYQEIQFLHLGHFDQKPLMKKWQEKSHKLL
ncbi:serine/threonine-protein kinase ATG1a isoform X1 [Fagus crenata]